MARIKLTKMQNGEPTSDDKRQTERRTRSTTLTSHIGNVTTRFTFSSAGSRRVGAATFLLRLSEFSGVEVCCFMFLARVLLGKYHPYNRKICPYHCSRQLFSEGLGSGKFISHLIYPLTARVIGAPQIISEPFFSIFPVLHWSPRPAKLQACPFPDVVFPSRSPSASSSSPFHCVLQDGLGQT